MGNAGTEGHERAVTMEAWRHSAAVGGVEESEGSMIRRRQR